MPSRFDEAVQRKAEHFGILLDLLKKSAYAGDTTAQAAIAKAQAILAGADDPC